MNDPVYFISRREYRAAAYLQRTYWSYDVNLLIVDLTRLFECFESEDSGTNDGPCPPVQLQQSHDPENLT